MNATEYWEALRPRPRAFRWFVALLAAVVVAWLGWCTLQAVAADRYFDFQKALARSCLDNGAAFAGGECIPVVVSFPFSAADPDPFAKPLPVPPL